jgi:ABC-type multidrug transport system ATPase subunit
MSYQNGIELRGVGKVYGDRVALSGLDLNVARGEVVALVGPNGAGKSTTLRILSGAIHPSSGIAQVGGRDVALNPLGAREMLGYLPQRLGVPLSTVVRDLAALVSRCRGLPADAGARALAEAHLRNRLGATLGEISGGQRQRVMLVLATLGPAEALLLDEPSISLDTEGAEEVRDAIAAARFDGASILFASHHLSDVALLADRIGVMVEGRLVACGTVEELAQRAGVSWDVRAVEPPIDRIYRVLVQGIPAATAATRPTPLKLVSA